MRKILGLILLILHVSVLHAQDYVYSVTLGTSWAREVFPAQERLERRSREANPLVLDGAPNFTQAFLQFEANYRKYNLYNDSIFINQTQREWIDMFKRRALSYSNLYSVNNQSIAELKDYFIDETVPEAAYDSLYYWTRHLFFRNANDIFFFETLMDILLPHYEEKQDIEHLIFCYLCSGMANFQISRIGDKDSRLRSELYFHKIMNLADGFASFKDPLNRYYLISAYVNLAILHAQAGDISLKESRELSNSMKKLFAQPETQIVLQKDSLLNEYAKWSVDLSRFRGILTYISMGKDIPDLRDQLYQDYCDVRSELGISSYMKNRYYGKLEYDDLLVEAFMGNKTWDIAMEEFIKKWKKDPEMELKNGYPSIKINYLYNLFQTFITLLSHTTYSDNEKSDLVKDGINHILQVISSYEHSKYPFEKGQILANIVTNPITLKYLSTREKQELLFRLVVVEQPTTYVHSSMVADLTQVLTENLIDKKPEYFIGVPGYNTVEDVVNKRTELLSFAYLSAIYHDLGKISMPTIINNCFRRLTDHEYDIIKLHPEKAARFFGIDMSFMQYQDIAYGHHKWYDGDGYPSRFKNRKSRYFPIICIVSVTDCLDAATENIGRNYHTPREFEDVLKEFRTLSGEQFNPELLEFIDNDSVTYNKMKLIVDDGRLESYYSLYNRYMDKSKTKNSKPIKSTGVTRGKKSSKKK